ncbi:putrescine transport system substrate-binding protein [Thiothrix eikelboomii]|uniref:Putrescine-binding periplasmic protein n=1 Tax=Thiothrix eikelboomii TaxID=92487 RepID=A0A1T4VRU1_9GAMM|nr:polyamine ABC transporter substrate-binding protein [Thiothrix eikelboomii]SKA67578.1 putrescine transport system substrate-binding protein [Thiothrix eikelboomii]
MKETFAHFKKLAVSTMVATTLAFSVATPSTAEERSLNIYNWSDYIDNDVLKEFTEKTGIKVNYDVFDSNELLETKLSAGSSGYDLVVPTANFLARQIEAKIFQKLDKTKLPNLANSWDMVNERVAVYDPGQEYSVNYLWGTIGVGYSEEKVKKLLPDAPVDSWDMVFKPEVASKLAECGIYLLDSSTDIIPPALKYLGLDPNDFSKDNLKKAEELLLKVRPYIKKFHSSEFITALANGDICVAVGFSGDIFQAESRAAEAKNGITVKYVIPKEGSTMWFDQMAIPADAKNVAEAHEFINFVMEPKNIARISNAVSYANGNKPSQEFINKEILENPAIYPTEEVMKNLFTVKTLDNSTQRLFNRSWTTIKSGQ